MQAFIRLRDAIFCEEGYNLDVAKVAPNGLHKDFNIYFTFSDIDGKTVRLDPIGDGSFDRAVHSIPMKSYPSEPALARRLVLHMEKHLRGALENSEEDQEQVGAAWRRLAVDCLLPREDQHYLRVVLPVLKNVFGDQRIAFAFNQSAAPRGRVIALEDHCFDGLRDVSSAVLVKEALTRNTPMSLSAPSAGAV